MNEKLNITIPALPRPTLKELQEKWPWIQSIESDRSPEEAVTLELDTVLKKGENYISGMEYERRIKDIPVLGYQQAVCLVEHQDEFPEFKKLCGKIYIDFLGLMVLDDDGDRSFPCLHESGGRWGLVWGWVDSGLDSGGRVARSGKSKPRNLDSRNLEIESLTLELGGKKYKVEGEIKLKEIK
jgi:hypothetical protein